MFNTDTVPVKNVYELLETAVDKGCDINSLLDSVSLSRQTLDNGETIPLRQFCQLLQRVTLVTKGRLFGLQGDADDPAGGFRMMCCSILHCNTLGNAIERAEKFYTLFGDPCWRFQLEHRGNQATLHFNRKQDGTPPPFKAHYYMAIWYRFWEWLCGRYIKLNQATFIDKPITDFDRYYELFQCKLEFEKQENSISFPACFLDSPIVHNDESIQNFLDTAPYQLMVMPWDKDDTLTSKIRFIIGCDFTHELPGIKEITNILHMSPTTLRRKLKQEGTTYQEIKDDTRRDAAISYLSRPDLSIKSSAYLMGFEDPCAFNRSFKKWTGFPPGEYRERYLKVQSQ